MPKTAETQETVLQPRTVMISLVSTSSHKKLEVSLVSTSTKTMRHTTSTCGLWQNSLPCRGHARDLLQHPSPRHSQDWRYHVQRWYHPVEQNETKMLNLEMLHCSHDLRPQITNPLISDPILWFSNFFRSNKSWCFSKAKTHWNQNLKILHLAVGKKELWFQKLNKNTDTTKLYPPLKLDLELRISFWDAIFWGAIFVSGRVVSVFSLRFHVKAQEFPKPLKMRYVKVELENHKAEDFPELLEITRHL